MAHLLILYGQREPTNIMIEEFFVSICHGNNLEVKALKVDDMTEQLLVWSDIVMGIRTQNILEADIMVLARKNGRLVIEMIDDDLLALKDYHIRRPLQEKALLQALNIADIVLGGNEELLKKYQSYNQVGRYVMLHTALDENEIVIRKESDSVELNIAYYASDGVNKNYDQIIRPTLMEIQDVLKKPIHWHFFTTHPDMSNTPFANSTTYYEFMPIDEFREKLSSIGIDIGIAPLIDSKFNSGKYVNKFFEFSRAGIPAIYSKVQPYAGFVKDGVDGILADNSKEAWIAAFGRLADREQRVKIRDTCQMELRTEYSFESVEKKIMQDIPELLYGHKNWDKKPILIPLKVRNRLYNLADKPIRAVGRMKTDGLKSTFRWITGHYIFKLK